VLRELVLRFRVLVRAGFFAAPDGALFARAAGALRVLLARVDPVVEDFARAGVALFAVLRLAVERFAVALRAPALREEEERDAEELEPAAELSSAVHLPDMTR
jgi:hypothetical protein